MKSNTINWPSGKTEIVFGRITELIKRISSDKDSIYICDDTILRLYPDLFSGKKIIKIEVSEKAKTLSLMNQVYSQLMEHGADRNTYLIGVGGGITCDIAGYAAATFYRGMPLILVPTTLLSMVDAAVGGKNGVNYNEHKNLIGTIRQPEYLLIDTCFLKTLPEIQIKNGMAEVIKYAFISGNDLYNKLVKDDVSKSWFDSSLSEELVWQIMKVKIDLVQSDEQEAGKRKILNFGHTLGHIIELQQKITHGEAVSIGMAMAVKVSKHLKKCTAETEKQVFELLLKYNLPVSTHLKIHEITEHLHYDKKKSGSKIHFVFIETTGNVYAELIQLDELKKILLEVFE